jgi:hypothetical protein
MEFGGFMKLSRLLYAGLLVPGICFAQLKNENLLQSLPQGYKIDFQTRKENMIITEMVPQGETVKDWTEMVTVQVFLGLKDATPDQFQEFMAKTWLAACKDGEVAPITKGQENGYPFSIWLQSCPLNPATGKPENTWFKAIKGNDSFYVVQKASKFDPSKEQITQWMKYFRSIMVCDTRLADRSCPKLEKANQ